MINDEKRTLITRWRLSSHPLYIETGRYKTPIVPRENRLCMVCNVVEDEYHALFTCTAHCFIRLRFQEICSKYTTVVKMFNPATEEDITTIAKYIREIEKNMEKLKLTR